MVGASTSVGLFPLGLRAQIRGVLGMKVGES